MDLSENREKTMSRKEKKQFRKNLIKKNEESQQQREVSSMIKKYGITRPAKPKISWKMIVYLLCVIGFVAFIRSVTEPIERGLFLFAAFILPLGFYLYVFIRDLSDYNLSQNDWEKYVFETAKKRQAVNDEIATKNELLQKEKREAELSQQDGTPWRKRYSAYPCPYCGHYKVRFAKWDDKKMSVAFWGVWSNKVGKSFHCDYCKRDFNN